MNKLLATVAGTMITVLVLGLATINFNHYLHLPELRPIQVVQSKYVDMTYPYIHTKTDVRLKTEVGNAASFDKLGQVLEETKKGDLVVFHLAGYGGDGESMFLLINNIKRTKAFVLMSVEAPVYSAHAYLATQGDGLTMAPYSFLMFHTISAYGYDCSQEQGLDRTVPTSIKCQQQIDILLYESNKLIMSVKFLTNEEKTAIMTGQDVYITAEQLYSRVVK